MRGIFHLANLFDSIFNRSDNFVHNCIDVIPHIVVREADNFIAQVFQIFSSCLVVFDLVLLEMRLSIDLNKQFCLGAVKINDEPVNGMLPAKLVFQISVSQMSL